ncbi:MAG: hypothetical protein JWO75_986 [Actinomycetia bacterium]|nr:hypothetical protein [Actinomycetes bacterium]
MRRRIATLAPLSVIVVLSVLACSGAPAAPTAARAPATPQAPRTTAAWGFAVSGARPVPANGSEDTRAQAAGATCDLAQLAADNKLGNEIAGGFAAAGFPAAADLLRHFLAGEGTGVNYPAGSRISRLAVASSAFQVVNGQVQAAVARRLKAGDVRVKLAAWQLPTVTFSVTTSDLYWSFRGTQGLAVTGSGSRESGRYVGTLTYVIRDSYGFPVDDTLDGFGPPMRYLQTVCGAPQYAGGAHWFPDTITLTVPFDQPA